MPFQSIEPRRLYRQIADQIRGLIKSGEFPAGARLPPERDLAKQLGVSRPTRARGADRARGRGAGRSAHRLRHLRACAGERQQALERAADARRRRAVRALARALRDRGGMRGARREVGETGTGAGDRGRARRDAARARSTGEHRRRAAIGCFTCASRRRPATARWSHVDQDAVGRAHGPLYQQLEHHYDVAGLWETRDEPSIARC